MPSVTMNEGIAQTTVIVPLINPQANPSNRHSGRAIQIGHSQPAMATPSAAAPKAITEPTDKSMPPIINTKVMPTAMTVKSGT